MAAMARSRPVHGRRAAARPAPAVHVTPCRRRAALPERNNSMNARKLRTAIVRMVTTTGFDALFGAAIVLMVLAAFGVLA